MNNGSIVESSFLRDQKRSTGFATARELPSSQTNQTDSDEKNNVSQTRISSHSALKQHPLFKPILLAKSKSPIRSKIEETDTNQPVQERLLAQKDKYKSQANLRKEQREKEIAEQMRQAPKINENSKKLLQDGKHQSYVNLKVEDRLRLYGIQLNETRASKAALDAMNNQYESQLSNDNKSFTTSTIAKSTSNLKAQSDARSFISSTVVEARQTQRDFQRRQEEHAKKKEELKKKLNDKYEFKPRQFKSREVSTTPTRSAAMRQKKDAEVDDDASDNGLKADPKQTQAKMNDFQRR